MRISDRNLKILKIALCIVALAVLVFVLIYSNVMVADSANTFKGLGEPCPEFTVKTYEDDRESYSVTESRGKVTVVNFWAITCGPCVQELPHFERLLNNYSEQVEVIAVHQYFGTEGLLSEVWDFITDMKWDKYNIIFAQDEIFDFTEITEDGEQAVSTELFKRLGGRDAWPTTVIIDAEGVIQYVRHGSITYEALEQQVKLQIAQMH